MTFAHSHTPLFLESVRWLCASQLCIADTMAATLPPRSRHRRTIVAALSRGNSWTTRWFSWTPDLTVMTESALSESCRIHDNMMDERVDRADNWVAFTHFDHDLKLSF